MSRREEENKLNSENIGREKSWVARCFFPEPDFWTANIQAVPHQAKIGIPVDHLRHAAGEREDDGPDRRG